jgi:hypothetical protein
MQQNLRGAAATDETLDSDRVSARDVIFIRGAGEARTRDQRITKRPLAAVSFGVAASTFVYAGVTA